LSVKRLIIVLLVLFLLGVAFYSMRGTLTPYVPFSEAMESDEYVQVLGSLVKSAPPQHFEGSFSFDLVDNKGTFMKVLYRGTKPLNFEHAQQVVALGTYMKDRGIFEAERILVKCPSKYTRKKQP
jgi:cytochrome c-type biogenesis protein CcmE